MARDLYGDHVRPTYDVDPTLQPELFTATGGSGSAWMRAAEEWAAERGLIITQWRLNQMFHAHRTPKDRGCWYRMTWDEQGWTVS